MTASMGLCISELDTRCVAVYQSVFHCPVRCAVQVHNDFSVSMGALFGAMDEEHCTHLKVKYRKQALGCLYCSTVLVKRHCRKL